MGGDTSTNPDQQYSLRWNDFHSSILSSFRHLRDEEDFVDVTLACDGCSFTAHKVVLSACSPYFRRLLKANPCQHPIIILRDVHQKDMENLLRFMYNGEVHVGHEHLTDFIKTAQMLQVRGLADVPSGAPSERLTATTTTTTTTATEQRISPTSSSLPPWVTDRPNLEKDDLASPPAKRARSAERDTFHHTTREGSLSSNNNRDIPESLLGQALETGHTMLPKEKSNNFESSIQNQSTGEESCSSDVESDQGDGEVVATPKTEPMSDYNNMGEHNPFQNGGFLNQNRPSPFPDALLNLGLGLMPPGTSGIPGNPNDYGDATPTIRVKSFAFEKPPVRKYRSKRPRILKKRTIEDANSQRHVEEKENQKPKPIIPDSDDDIPEVTNNETSKNPGGNEFLRDHEYTSKEEPSVIDLEDILSQPSSSNDQILECIITEPVENNLLCSVVTRDTLAAETNETVIYLEKLPAEKNDEFECPLCNLVFSDIAFARMHIDDHYPRDSLICPVEWCQKVFINPNSVRNHMRVKHSNEWEAMKRIRWVL